MWRELDGIITDSIIKGFPSAQIIIEKSGKVIKSDAYGQSLIFPKKIDATKSTLYDIASLTKILSLTYAFQYLHTEHSFDLNQTVEEILGESVLREKVSREKCEITLRHLLSHQAGFEPNPLFYDRHYSETLFCQNRALFLDKLLQAPLIYPPGSETRYSDVDYMLLTFVFEAIVGQRLDKWLAHHFWMPLGLTDIAYNPLNTHHRDNIAGTELMGNRRGGAIYFENIRTAPIWGEVQDEKAFHCMEGISGHAGLFTNAKTLLRLLKLMYDKEGFFSRETIQQFMRGNESDPSFGLGWRINRRKGLEFMFGDYASPTAYGHTGWTGCLLLHDPQYALSIVYLTNRKHTAIVNPALNPNLFYGDQLPAGKYRSIVNSIYHALGLNHHD